jgi:hypothetical protein
VIILISRNAILLVSNAMVNYRINAIFALEPNYFIKIK